MAFGRPRPVAIMTLVAAGIKGSEYAQDRSTCRTATTLAESAKPCRIAFGLQDRRGAQAKVKVKVEEAEES
jgi:hypothetical protein